MLTAWDGYSRVDYLAGSRRLQVTLLTVEPTIRRTVRPGLTAAFVADDPDGPPVFVGVDVPGGINAELRVLLGSRLADAAEALIGSGAVTTNVRVGLTELAMLSATWTPYRAEVLGSVTAEDDLRGADHTLETGRAPDAPGGTRRALAAMGTWAGERWAWLGGATLGDALAAFASREQVRELEFRETSDEHWEDWVLPAALAAAAGVEPVLRWQILDDVVGTGVAVAAEPVPGERGTLFIGLDNGTDEWVPLEPDATGALLAELPLPPGTVPPPLRARSRQGDSDD